MLVGDGGGAGGHGGGVRGGGRMGGVGIVVFFLFFAPDAVSGVAACLLICSRSLAHNLLAFVHPFTHASMHQSIHPHPFTMGGGVLSLRMAVVV